VERSRHRNDVHTALTQFVDLAFYPPKPVTTASKVSASNGRYSASALTKIDAGKCRPRRLNLGAGEIESNRVSAAPDSRRRNVSGTSRHIKNSRTGCDANGVQHRFGRLPRQVAPMLVIGTGGTLSTSLLEDFEGIQAALEKGHE
jgi:hypothetical protein